jgi:hypothetical protein
MGGGGNRGMKRRNGIGLKEMGEVVGQSIMVFASVSVHCGSIEGGRSVR